MTSHGRIAAVSGASGYLGSRIVRMLEARGWRVVRLVRDPSPGGGESRRFDLAEAVPSETLSGVDLLVHAAYDQALRRPSDVWRVNVAGTRRLLAAARDAGVGRVIVLSSMSAFAGTKQLYGRAKLEIEALAAELGGFAVRPGLVYGDEPGGMIGALRKMMKLPVVPLPAGGARQYPVHEDDVVAVIEVLAGLDALPAGPIGITPEDPVTFRDLLRSLGEKDGRHPILVPVPWPLVYWGLRAAESVGFRVPFRADSMLGLARPATSVPRRDELARLGVTIRPFRTLGSRGGGAAARPGGARRRRRP